MIIARTIFLLLLLSVASLGRADDRALERANAELSAGNFPAARDAFLAIVASDAKNARALHGAGLSILHLGETARALPHLQKAYALSSTDRAICINYSAALIRARNPMRAIRVLIDAQPRAGQPLDEPLVNALQSALAAVDESGRKNRIWLEGESVAADGVARLEAARPGWKRFGQEWRAAEDVDALTVRNNARRARLDRLTTDLATLDRQLGQLVAEARVIEKRVQHGFDWPGRLDAHMERVRDVERQVARLRNEIDTTREDLVAEPAPAAIQLVALDALAPPFEPWEAPVPPPSTAPVDPDELPADPPTTAIPPRTPPVTGPPAAPPVKPQVAARHAVALAVTEAQLVVPATELTGAILIEVRQGGGRAMTARHVRTDRATGLAVIEINGGKLKPAPLAATTNPGRARMIDFPRSSLFDVISRGSDVELLRTNDRLHLAPADDALMSGAVIAADDGVIGLILDGERRTVADVAAIRAVMGNAPRNAEPAHDPADAVYHLTISVAR